VVEGILTFSGTRRVKGKDNGPKGVLERVSRDTRPATAG
jgi:hypothetical protein